MAPSESSHQPQHRISATAVSIALLMVLAAILFGIYGPRIAGRLTLMGGVPLSDVVEAAANLRGPAVLSCLHQENGTVLKAGEQTPLLTRLLGRPFQLPDLSATGYVLRRISAVSLPGAPYRSAELVYQRMTADSDRWLVLYLAADDGQYLAFDALGRSRQFMPKTLLHSDISMSGSDESSALVWSDGPVLYLACIEDDQEAVRLRTFFDSL